LAEEGRKGLNEIYETKLRKMRYTYNYRWGVKMRKLFNVLFAVILLILVFPACSTGPQQLHNVKGEFVEGVLGEDAQTLNWIIATDGGASKRYASFIIDPLAVFDNKFALQLRCLAKDIEISADGLTYTVTIRTDLKWSDGSAVTAEDYVYTLKNIMFADWIECTDKTRWQELVDGKPVFVSLEKITDSSFKVLRKTVDPDFVYTIYDLMPYPKYIVVHYEKNAEAFTGAPELDNLNYGGNLGAYKAVTWNSTDGFVMKRNPEYYLGKSYGAPYFEKYTIKPFGLQQLINDSISAGRVSFAYIEPQTANDFRSQGETNVYTIPTGYYVYLAYNQRNNGWEGLKDVRVRQAISMIVDKPMIMQTMYLGYADPAFSFVPPYSPLYNESVLNKYGMTASADAEKAISLIKSAGYEQKLVDGKMVFVDKEGNPIKLNFLIDMESDFEQNLGIIIRGNLMQIGLDINPKFSTRQILFSDGLMNKEPDSKQVYAFNNGPKAVSNQAWDLAVLSSHANPLALKGSAEFFTSKGKFNVFGFFNEKADALFARAYSAEALTLEGRKQIYSDITKLISDEQPVDFLVFYKDNYAFRNTVKGVEPGINMFYNNQFWYFE
jgi:peptide/nickel transport system substrate-binding protein